jgi:hypothetical protein
MKVSLDKKNRTRDGKSVTLHDVSGLTTFPVKGSIHRTTPSGRTKYEYMIWTMNGGYQISAMGDHPLDLVEVTP